MFEPCLAILERALLGKSRSSTFAAEQGCIFCQSRELDELCVGDAVVVLNGYSAGATFRVESLEHSSQLLGAQIYPPPEHDEHKRYLKLPYELMGKLPLSWPPDWYLHLSLRESFCIDELATWFCNRGMATGNFVWRETDVNEVIRVVWQKRLPVTAAEVVSFFAAHGLPQNLHSAFQDRFETGMRLLCYVSGRPPIKKRRLKSFAEIERDPCQWYDRFILPGLH